MSSVSTTAFIILSVVPLDYQKTKIFANLNNLFYAHEIRRLKFWNLNSKKGRLTCLFLQACLFKRQQLIKEGEHLSKSAITTLF
jgi:hypothetical protein